MRNRLLGVLTLTGILAAGAAFAADSTMPGSTAPAAAPATTPAAPAAVSSGSTAMPTAVKSDVVKLSSHTGIVKSFDAKTRLLTLMDGTSYSVDESLKGEDLKADTHVAIGYKTEGQKKIVTDYKIVTSG